MINIRNLLASQANELKHKENLKKQRAFQSSPLQSISPKENEKLIKIDKFIFSVFHNIESIDYELNLGITKVESISTNYYLKLGGNEKPSPPFDRSNVFGLAVELVFRDFTHR